MKPVVLFLILLSFFALPAGAQVASGAITGTVTNESGAVVPGAQISVKEVSTGVARTATTNNAGLYYVADLSAGAFEMTVSASGFVSQVWTSINVTAGAERILNVSLKTGKADPATRVVAPPAPVSEVCASNCGTANTATVRDTPLNGRDWAALATLQAGVSSVQNGSASGGGNMDRGFGAAVSVSGSRPDQNAYILDGISINDYANGAPGSVLGDNLGIDAVEQVSVLGSNYPAQFGRTSGGVINVVTRAGKNAFHGSLYEFLRNSALDARNFFDGPVIPPFKRNQFGGSAGFPIKKDRTFLFGDYEGLRQSLGVTTVNTVPSAAARGILQSSLPDSSNPTPPPSPSTAAVLCSIPQGPPNPCSPQNVSGAFNPDPTSGVDTSVQQFLQAFYPLPNYPTEKNPILIGNGDTGQFRFAAQQITNENYATVRFDHVFTDRDSVYATYTRDYSKTVAPGTFGELYSDIVSNRQAATFHEQHIFSTNFLNSGYIGFARAVGIIGQIDRVLNPLMSDPSYAFIPGGFAGRITLIPGLTDFLGAPRSGFVPSSRSIAWNTYQGGDDAVLTHGRHLIKFGANVERMQSNQLTTGIDNGSFRFDSLAQFLTNQPSSFAGNGSPFLPDVGIRETLVGGYVQDDIKVRKTFTLNAGLRYEMVTVPTEAHGRTAALRNVSDQFPVCGAAQTGCSGTGPLFSNPTLKNFEPRLGFAWNPREGKTLVRGGFGVFDVLPLPYEFTLTFQRVLPFFLNIVGENPQPGSFPAGAYSQFSNDLSSGSAYYPDPNPQRNYVMQWNLSVARELTSTLALTVGYVGSRGVHQPYRVDNVDMVLPTLGPAGYMWPCGPDGKGDPCVTGFLPSGAHSVKLNPNYGRVNATLWQANSFYDAMQVDVAKRVSHGIQFHGAYTFGKSIDTLSATEADDAFPNGLFNQIFFDQRTTRALSDFNVAQTAVVSATWEIPGPRKGSKVPEWAFGGWQLVGLYKVSTGQPFTPILGGDPAGTRLDETGLMMSIKAGCSLSDLVDHNFKKNSNGPIYLNANCLTVPLATPAIAAECQPFGLRPPGTNGSTDPGSPGIAGTCANLRGNLGRNVIIGPGLSKLDFSVFKNNYIRRISESFNAQFRAEIFNVFNHPNFSSPTDNLQVFDKNGQPISSAGLIDSTQTTSRQIQFALKLIW